MQTSEWIQILFAGVLAVAAWTIGLTRHPLPLHRRWIVTYLAVAAIGIAALGSLGAARLSPSHRPILLDGLTIVLFLIPYWQTGQFFLRPNLGIQDRLLAFDRWLLPAIATRSGTGRSSIGLLLEMAYLFCYPLVPLGLAAVYLTGLRSASFWLVLLISTYLCYAITPFVPAFPPRTLVDEPAHANARTEAANHGRRFNRWILQRGSIHAISFPSAHVASAFAIGLVLLRYSPPLGMVFLVIAILISLGAVIGRYHYALDVLLGAATSLAVFLASYRYLHL